MVGVSDYNEVWRIRLQTNAPLFDRNGASEICSNRLLEPGNSFLLIWISRYCLLTIKEFENNQAPFDYHLELSALNQKFLHMQTL